jgi:hypothetical protein
MRSCGLLAALSAAATLALAGCADTGERDAETTVLGGFGRCPGASYPDDSGDWRASATAAWLRALVVNARVQLAGETGSALIVCTGGHDLYAWTTEHDAPIEEIVEPGMTPLGVVGDLRVHGTALRAVWQVHDVEIWVEAGPRSPALPPLEELRPLVAATKLIAPRTG